MVDVVVNHFAYNGAPEDVDYSVYNPFNSYSQFHHPYCQINYADNSNLVRILLIALIATSPRSLGHEHHSRAHILTCRAPP